MSERWGLRRWGQVKIGCANYWLAKCCLSLAVSWVASAAKRAPRSEQDAPRTVTNMGEGDVMEETDTVQFFDKTANRLGVKVK